MKKWTGKSLLCMQCLNILTIKARRVDNSCCNAISIEISQPTLNNLKFERHSASGYPKPSNSPSHKTQNAEPKRSNHCHALRPRKERFFRIPLGPRTPYGGAHSNRALGRRPGVFRATPIYSSGLGRTSIQRRGWASGLRGR